MAKKSKFTCFIEYGALRSICGFVNALPYPAACALARGAASFAFHVLRLNRERTVSRIKTVFPEKTEKEVNKIALTSLKNFFQNAVEMIRAPRLSRKWMEKHVANIAVNAGKVRELANEGHGVITLVPHSGNWDLAAWALARFDVPLFAIAARQRNPLINDWINRQRESGMEVVERGSAMVMRDILNRLRKGRVFAILPDLRVPQKDTEVDFLNGKANISHGAAMFAVSTGAPVVVAVLRRENGIHTFDHLATLRPNPEAKDRKAEARRLITEAMRLIDAEIRRTPEQWFWYNKRWILEPVR